ncbi:MAG: response regulator transcription factor [Filomicrobium sp.]
MILLIIDGHPLIAEGVTRLFSDRADVQVSQVSCIASAKSVFMRLKPDIVIVELDLPDGSGLEFVETAIEQHPGVKVIVLTGAESAGSAALALEAGAKAFVGKSVSAETLVEAVNRVAEGKSWLPEGLVQEVATLRLSGAATSNKLSKREIDILHSLAHGESLNEIAFRLGISYKTVAKDSNRLRERYGAKSLPELVRLAIDKKLF